MEPISHYFIAKFAAGGAAKAAAAKSAAKAKGAVT